MKRFFGWVFRGIAFLLMSMAYAVPTTVLAFYFAVKGGHSSPEPSNMIMSVLLCIILVFVATRVPIRKNRALWACVVGLLFYAVLSYFVIFGFARDTVSILKPFRYDVHNDILIYVGAGVFLFGVLLGAQGRAMTRENRGQTKPRAPEIKAREPEQAVTSTREAQSAPAAASEQQPVPVVQVRPVMPQSVVTVGQIPVVPFSVQPVVQQPVVTQVAQEVPHHAAAPTETGAPVEYVKDEWGNLIARHNLPRRNDHKK